MKYKYKRIDNNSMKGQKQAERLISRGWYIYEVTPVYMYLRKEVVAKGLVYETVSTINKEK